MGIWKIIKKVGIEVGTAIASFALGYFTSSETGDKTDSNDKNSGVINNEIKIVEKEEKKEHIEYMVYAIAVIVLLFFLIKSAKHIKAKFTRKQTNTRDEEHELDRFAHVVV